jgi:integrase
MRFFIKRPNSKFRRKTFAVYKRDGKRNSTVKIPDLDALNESLIRGIVDPITAEKSVKLLVKRLYAQNGINTELPSNADNERILNEYWQRQYKHRKLVDRNSARYKLERAVRAMGDLSLLTATQEQFQEKLDSLPFNPTKVRQVASSLQLIINFLKRDIVLARPPKEHPDVVHVTEEELSRIIGCLESEHLRVLVEVLFYSGCRLGEAFGLSEIKVRKDHLVIDTQIDSRGSRRLPKCRKRRKAFISKKAIIIVQRWLDLKDTFLYSRTNALKIFKQAAFRALKRDVTLHDLRHSYAISLLSKGVPLSLVAQSMGNSEKVCEEYYTGFVLVDEAIETIKKIVD